MTLFSIKSLSALFRDITSTHKGDYYCLNCFKFYRIKGALEKHMKVYEDKDYCYIGMPEKDTFIKYHPGIKSMRSPHVIYADIESLLKKIDTCINDPSKS